MYVGFYNWTGWNIFLLNFFKFKCVRLADKAGLNVWRLLFSRLFLFTHNLPSPCLCCLSVPLFLTCLSGLFPRRSAACPVELLPVCVCVCAPWRASFVSWRPTALPPCSVGCLAWSCRPAVQSSHHAFASSGPIKLLDDAPVQVRYTQGFGMDARFVTKVRAKLCNTGVFFK